MSRFAFTVRRILGLLGTVVLFTIAVLLANTFVALGWLRPLVVAGDSMAPHYSSQEPLLVRRWAGPINRWDVVVARSPLDANVRVIKRVVGLPGERLTIRDGDVWINDARIVKSLAEQKRLRLLVETISQSYSETFSIDTVNDSLPTNERISRRLNRVDDLMIEMELYCEPRATWSVQIANRFTMEITENGEARLLDTLGECLERTKLSDASPWQVMVSSFDSGALLTIEGVEIFSRSEVTSRNEREKAPLAIAVASTGGKTEMRELSVWRDVYYEAMPVAGSPATGPSEATWELGPHDYFVVGDNQAISVDSRHSGVLPRRLIEGIVR